MDIETTMIIATISLCITMLTASVIGFINAYRQQTRSGQKPISYKVVLIPGIVSIIIWIVLVAGSISGSPSGSGGDGVNSSKKCAYKENGRSVCSSKAAAGSNFCSYHQGYLDSIYDGFVGK